MVKLEEKFSSLTATILSNKYKGNQNFVVEQVKVGDFFDKGTNQVKLILNDGKKEKYSFVLNSTNSDFLNRTLVSLDIEPDSDFIEIGSKLTLESYDTGGKGTYQYGVKIVDFVLPQTQSKL